MTTREAVASYIAWGLQPTPYRAGEKQPARSHFLDQPTTAETLEEDFPDSENRNVGLVTGGPLRIVNVDLDCPLARKLYRAFLPKTNWVTGRAGGSPGNLFYRAPDYPMNGDGKGPYANVGFVDELPGEFDGPHGRTILEVRTDGRATVIPPSQYVADGDTSDIVFFGQRPDGPPTEVAWKEIEDGV